jgi:hypothetical protein
LRKASRFQSPKDSREGSLSRVVATIQDVQAFEILWVVSSIPNTPSPIQARKATEAGYVESSDHLLCPSHIVRFLDEQSTLGHDVLLDFEVQHAFYALLPVFQDLAHFDIGSISISLSTPIEFSPPVGKGKFHIGANTQGLPPGSSHSNRPTPTDRSGSGV